MESAQCSLCGDVGPISYVCDELGSVCDHCDATDKDTSALLSASAEKIRDKKRNAMHNIAKRRNILHRVQFPNEGTCLLDGRVYYYAQKRTARVKGKQKYYQMRGFAHFVDIFGN